MQKWPKKVLQEFQKAIENDLPDTPIITKPLMELLAYTLMGDKPSEYAQAKKEIATVYLDTVLKEDILVQSSEPIRIHNLRTRNVRRVAEDTALTLVAKLQGKLEGYNQESLEFVGHNEPFSVKEECTSPRQVHAVFDVYIPLAEYIVTFCIYSDSVGYGLEAICRVRPKAIDKGTV